MAISFYVTDMHKGETSCMQQWNLDETALGTKEKYSCLRRDALVTGEPRRPKRWGSDAGEDQGAACSGLAARISLAKTFSNLLNSVHHPFAGARCSADTGGASDSIETQ
ncbi:hypothetical protein LMH87_000899 [Akanthomyces muscarius]|uniref:Uncharacterized protein n=1 Tax=Akanthomyces muscarius TaxID=2231603 RepID=A0A9W8QI98_AKAMU|nr:hypothetical protein LMH87_000899 [Akanthomyces muscarius]KAJ4155663.1 hypothetical protein LMH87_000899 [Akanthomyces muscarius]